MLEWWWWGVGGWELVGHIPVPCVHSFVNSYIVACIRTEVESRVSLDSLFFDIC